MFFKKTPHRIFDYTPRFYKPEEDKDVKIWLIIIAVAIYIYLKLTGIA